MSNDDEVRDTDPSGRYIAVRKIFAVSLCVNLFGRFVVLVCRIDRRSGWRMELLRKRLLFHWSGRAKRRLTANLLPGNAALARGGLLRRLSVV